ncbi:hypothetical protein I6U48_06685 [Clostridium sp. PL3]|uniref:DUF5667 domain-containing protein n=1 Tax=Clostridium thailandense TaxID=2794346 RepID=A0A949TGY6_9CLOT|nr:DUF5667 domain-containing protein [Clostridium thailandense]MBV7272604.1 hypothetical protein [Clostridium thailandense]
MKKIALFVAAAAVSLSVGGKALADTNTISFTDKAGITPDNVLLYPIDKAIDNIRINLTFADDKKAQVLIDVAKERLGESEVMADKGKTDLSIQAMNSYNDKMAESQSNIENAIDNTTTNTTTDSTAKSDNLNAVETTIENAQTNSIEVLKNIEKKLSGNADKKESCNRSSYQNETRSSSICNRG